MDGRDEAVGRHPAAGRWRPDTPRLARRLAAELAREGVPWPGVAAAALAAREASGLDRVAFAGSLGVTVEALDTVEHGACALDQVPVALRERMRPWLAQQEEEPR